MAIQGSTTSSTTLSPAAQAIINQASAGATSAYNQEYQGAQQQLAANQANYGPGGVQAGYLQTNYQQQEAQNQLALQGIQSQQAYANVANPIEQQQYGISQQQYGIGQEQYGVTQNQLALQSAQNANTFGQQVQGQNSAAAASGATDTAGNRNAQSQIQQIYGPQGFNQQGINLNAEQAAYGNQITQLGNQSAQLGQQSTLAQQQLQNQQLQQAAAANGISGQELLTGLNQGIQNLGLQGATNAGQIISGLGQDYSNLSSGLASIYSQIGTAGNIPQLLSPGS